LLRREVRDTELRTRFQLQQLVAVLQHLQELGEAKASDLMISRSGRVVIPGSGRVAIVQAIFCVCVVCACFCLLQVQWIQETLPQQLIESHSMSLPESMMQIVTNKMVKKLHLHLLAHAHQ
jgi:hypothetical protein